MVSLLFYHMAFIWNPYGMLSLGVAIVNLAIALYVFRKRPRHKLNQVYGLLTFLSGVFWPLAEFFLRSTDDANSALIYARLAWTWVLLSPALMLHLAYIMSRRSLEKRDNIVLGATYGICLAFIWLVYTTDLMISGIRMAFWGYTGIFGPLVYAYAMFFFLLIAESYYLLYRRYRESEILVERLQTRYVMAGLSFPFVFGAILQIFFPLTGIMPLPVASITTIMMDGLIAYAIVRYNFLIINPAPEGKMKTEPKYTVESKTLFVLDQQGERGFDMFVDQIMHGRPGLCVSEREPDELRSKYGFTKTPIIWLTDAETEHRSVPPKDLKQLSIHILDFLARGESSIVVFDGVDGLIETNGFDQTYALIREVNGKLVDTLSSLIVSVRKMDDLELLQLQLHKEDVEREIEFAKNMYLHCELDEENFRDIVKGYQCEIIQIELKMSKIADRKKGRKMEIVG